VIHSVGVVVQVCRLQDGDVRIPMTMVPAIVASALLILRGKRQRYCIGCQDESGSKQFARSGFHIVPPPLCPAPDSHTASANASSSLIYTFLDYFNCSAWEPPPIPP
jgi:hypothetical protein